MITNITNENGIINATYDSSNITSTSFDTNDNTLFVNFVKGNLTYKYLEVDPVDYNKLQNSDSTGKAFIDFIKTKYIGERI
jgi:hypothetical protein